MGLAICLRGFTETHGALKGREQNETVEPVAMSALDRIDLKASPHPFLTAL